MNAAESSPVVLELLELMRESARIDECALAFGQATQTLSGAEICMVNLYDTSSRTLRCVEVLMPAAMEHMRASYINFTFAPGSDNYRVFDQRQPLVITGDTVGNCSSSSQLAFDRWHMRQIVILPLIPHDGHEVCAGSVTLMAATRILDDADIARLRSWLRGSVMLLYLHMNCRAMSRRLDNLRDAEAEIDSMLQFVAKASNLRRVDDIFPMVLREFLRRFDLDFGAIWMESDAQLQCVASELYGMPTRWFGAWQTAAKDQPYSARNAKDGAASYVFNTGQPMRFDDIPATTRLTIPEKDARLLTMADGLQSMSLHPIRRNGKSSGVLAMYSLRRKSALSMAQMEQIAYWADFLGAVLDSAATFAKLEARSLELSSSNAELAATLTTLRQTQEALVQSKKLSALGSIVVAVAHELNTPIGNAVTVTTTLEDDIDSFEKAMQLGLRRSTLERFVSSSKQASGMVAHNLERAVRLIRDFKEIAIDTSSAQREVFDPYAALQEIVFELRQEWQNLPVTIHLPETEECVCDSYRAPFCQVVANLLDNAVTHAFEGRGSGDVWIKLFEADDERLCLRVIDNGIGIDDAALERVFDPFFTARLGKGRSGLGLYITHNIVTSVLSGTIKAASELGKGTTFSVVMPRIAPRAGEFPSDFSP